MLTILLGTDWVANRNEILKQIAQDVAEEKGGRILMVPELISHDTERRLCETAGDTSSRFAEVLTFSRLTSRVCEWCNLGLEECLDNGGRLVAMASSARQLHSKLKAYASVETRPEFLTGLVDAVDEFKRCCITSQDLQDAASETEGAFSQKLEELALLLEAYDAVCERGKKDPRDQMTWLLEQLEECDFAQSHVFYIDGFPDFTRQHAAILEHLICNSPSVTISMNCDTVDTRNPAFEKASDTVSQILSLARNRGISVNLCFVNPRKDPLHTVSTKLFHGPVNENSQLRDRLRLCTADSVYEECSLAAEQIIELVHNGSRYRDIGVVCSDPAAYHQILSSIMIRCNIPAYIAGTEDILDKTVISTVLTALDAALGGFECHDVLRYLKSVLSPLRLEECDAIENYAVLWGIQGNRWCSEWTMHPEGLESVWNESHVQALRNLNTARTLAITPLEKLREGFRKAKSLFEQVEALYHFLDDIKLCDRLYSLSVEMDAAGDNRNAQILDQLWEILLTALEQLQAVLGHTSWDSETFTRLLKLLLSQYDVGTIPSVLDAVTIGPVTAMRCQQMKHLIVLGATEGAFPKYAGTSGVLTDQERKALRQMGVPLTGGAAEGLQIEFSEIFGVFCGAEDSIYVSCLTEQPSFAYRRLQKMVPESFARKEHLGSVSVNPKEAAAYFVRMEDVSSAQALSLQDLYADFDARKQYQLGKISHGSIEKLYGNMLNLSASQVDKQADCRLAYFLKYGLRAKPRKTAAVDPAEFGTYVHAVLENTAREVTETGGFLSTDLDTVLSIAQKHSDVYIHEKFSQIDSGRMAYLFARNVQELMMVVEELWRELQDSSFIPVGFEVAFGDHADLQAIPISGKKMNAQLRGFVDRVDAWSDGVRNFFRVVDYKTGVKSFDYCDVFNGLGLQMLLYLFALEQEGMKLLGEHPVPAGVQYFPARVPILSCDGELTDEEVEKERRASWKRKGLLLSDEAVLHAMEHSDPPQRLSCKWKKDGTLVGDIADQDQLKMLNQYIFRLLGKMVDEIASGNVEPNPYTRGSSHNACRFCDYATICHAATVEGRRNYKAMSAQRFWEEIAKEMSKLG